MTQKRNKSLLYEHEQRRQEKRQEIAKRLAEGRTYKQIQDELGVSSTTISAVKRMSESEG